METTPLISVAGLTYVYTTGRGTLEALSGVDLEVNEGVFMSVIGPSGGGKTTLLKVMGGLLAPAAGTVRLNGSPPHEAQRRKSIGYIFQDPSLLPWRSVFQNVYLPAQLNSGKDQIDEVKVEELIGKMGLSEFRDYYPHQLSAGMRQRVALARALVMEPAVLLMDEPLGALDDITRTAMRYEILRLWEGIRPTAVLVTHSISEAIMMSDIVAVMSSRPGRVLEQVPINLPRPRGEHLERTDRFLDYATHIRQTLSVGAPLGKPAP